MLLAVDIGNTQTVLGLYDGAKLVAHWRVATRDSDTSDQLELTLRGLFRLDGLTLTSLQAMAVASVVPPLTERYRLLGKALTNSEPLVVTGNTPCQLRLGAIDPSELGADRIADAVAALTHYGSPVIVVDFGTATNIEVIDNQGTLIGGVIAPGLQTSAEALFRAAARLAKIDIQVPPTVIGSSTRGAVQSGLTYGEIDRIDGLVERIFAELGYRAPVIATGGLSHRVVALSRTITQSDDNLTLEGLRIIWEQVEQAG